MEHEIRRIGPLQPIGIQLLPIESDYPGDRGWFLVFKEDEHKRLIRLRQGANGSVLFGDALALVAVQRTAIHVLVDGSEDFAGFEVER